MTISMLRDFFMWSAIINTGLLLYWVLIIMFASDFVYSFHSKWFKLSRDKFDAIHYSGIAFFKICIFVFNIVPFIALCIVGK